MEEEWMSQKNDINDTYSRNLKAVDYHKESLRTLYGSNREIFTFTLKFLHDVFRSGYFNGTKLLDIGSGPTVYNVASASAYFSSIVLSDFVEDNYDELARWLRGKSSLDWSEFLNIVVELEGYTNNLDFRRGMLETRIRQNVKKVIKCDILSESIIPIDDLAKPDVSPPYDVVISFWCLESVAFDFDCYVRILKKLHNLIRDKGGLILSGFMNSNTWSTEKSSFHHLKINEHEVERALMKAGFSILDLRVLKKNKIKETYNYECVYCVAASKTGTSCF